LNYPERKLKVKIEVRSDGIYLVETCMSMKESNRMSATSAPFVA